MTDESKSPLQPAGENPWYVLMTVAGEQTRESRWVIDNDLHARNRRYWNGWAARGLSDDARARLIAEGRVAEADFEPGGDLAPLTEVEQAAIAAALAQRYPDAKIPDPKDLPNLSLIEFSEHFCADGFLFPSGAVFRFATFCHKADFRSATFSCRAVFSSATFARLAAFQSASFSGDTKFQGATFSGAAFFEGATFSETADFNGATFSDLAVFEGVRVSAGAFFSDARFQEATSFAPWTDRGAPEPPLPTRFARPPTFYNASLHEDTDWTDVVWPDPPENRDDAIQFRRAYERLKLMMAEQNKFADEHFFLRRELECREIAEPGTLSTFASRAFRILSDYGWSVERPAAALAIAWGVGALLLLIAEWADYCLGSWPAPETTTPEFLGPGQAMGLSFSNLFAFLGLGWHIMRDELASLTAVSEIVAVAQMVAGPVLLFLLALGLRNRFRIK